MKLVPLVVLAALIVGSPSAAAVSAPAPSTPIDPTAVAIRDLDGRIRDAYGVIAPVSGDDPLEIADAFVEAHAAALGVGPGSSLARTSVRDSLTATHVRYGQSFDDEPVVRGEVSVHVRDDGMILAVHSRAIETLVAGTPAISAEQAILIAQRESPGVVLGIEPVIVPDGLVGRRAWEVEIESGPLSQPLVRVDRATGAILAIEEQRFTFTEEPARVWVNGIVASGNADLRDNPSNLEKAPAPGTPLSSRDFSGLMTDVTLVLDGDGSALAGPYVTVVDAKASGSYVFSKEDPRFEEVQAYYWIDWAKKNLDELGFVDVMDYSIPVRSYDPTMMGVFNAFYRRSGEGSGEIHFGWHAPTATAVGAGAGLTGFADSAEDAEVIVHEYAHAVLDNQVPNYNGGHMHEGWADFFSATMLARVSNGHYDWCMAEWFTSYIMRSSGGRPPCLRDLDNDLTQDYPGVMHNLGQVWSGALWNIREELGPVEAERLILEANFLMPIDGSFHEGAEALLLADANLHGATHARLIIDEFAGRNITRLIVTEDLLAKIQDAGAISAASIDADAPSAVPAAGAILAGATIALAGLVLRKRR